MAVTVLVPEDEGRVALAGPPNLIPA